MKFNAVLLAPVLIFSACTGNQTVQEDAMLIYKAPAKSTVVDKPFAWKDDPQWVKALPLGNGALGAMVYGDVATDRIQLNEESVWSGSLQDSDNPKASTARNKINALLVAEKYKEANSLAYQTQLCKGIGTNRANGYDKPYGSFQTLGDLWLDFDSKSPYEDYQRVLNLSKAEAKVSYTQNGVKYERDYFVSYPSQVLAVRLSADQAKKLSFTARLTRPERYGTHTSNQHLIMQGVMNDGKGGEGLHYMARLKAVADGGTVTYTDSTIVVKEADEVMLLLAASTDYVPTYPLYKGRDYEKLTHQRIEAASKETFQALRTKHLEDFMPLFGRSSFTLANSSGNQCPTDSLLLWTKKDSINARLYELSFSYGKYLLLTSSRPGTLPANLQGVWSNKINSPWNGDYHININLPMNYWPSEILNISETHLPVFDFINSLVAPGEKTAKNHYGLNGWLLNPCTNIWGFTSPGEGLGWGYYPVGAAWLCLDILEHYRFTCDTEFLKKMYPALEGAVRFLNEWLIKDALSGKYVASASCSPENAFVAPDGSKDNLTLATSHSQQLIWQLFTDFMEASRALQISSDFTKEVNHKLQHLAITPIGKDGRLLEWNKEFEEVDKGHRHLSHLVGLYPGSQFNTVQTPDYTQAAEKSIDYRIKHGCGYVGWSGAWLSNLFARVGRSEDALTSLDMVIKRMLPNLFNLGAPFQIEGNFGLSSGIAEMLLQSHVCNDGYQIIDILPALPQSWASGNFKGLKARGNFEVSAVWENNELKKVNVTSFSGRKCCIRYQGRELFKGELAKNKSWNLQ